MNFLPYSPKCLEGEFPELPLYGVLGSSHAGSCLRSPSSSGVPDKQRRLGAPTFTLYVKRPRMKAPATSSTRSTTTKIKAIGSKTTSAALPVVVECISRRPTTARYNP